MLFKLQLAQERTNPSGQQVGPTAGMNELAEHALSGILMLVLGFVYASNQPLHGHVLSGLVVHASAANHVKALVAMHVADGLDSGLRGAALELRELREMWQMQLEPNGLCKCLWACMACWNPHAWSRPILWPLWKTWLF